MCCWTLASALATESGARREWIVGYLSQPALGHSRLNQIVKEFDGEWEGPTLLPIVSLARGAGPSTSYKYAKDPDEWDQSIQSILAEEPTKDSFPPAIVFKSPSGVLELSDGNHRAAALEQIGETHMWVFVCQTSPFKTL